MRIPNPIPRIVDRIGKVGNFVGRTDRKIGQDEHDEEQRRTTPLPPEPVPVSPTAEDHVTAPRYFEREREREPYSPRPNEIDRQIPSPTTTNRPMTSNPSLAEASVTEAAAAAAAEGTEPLLKGSPSEPSGPDFGRPVPGRPGLVYPPGAQMTSANRVDVRGIPPGTMVRDPSTGQIFLVP